MNTKTSEIEPVFYPASKLARRWNCHPITIRRMIKSGELPSVRVGARQMVSIHTIVRAERSGGVGKPRRGSSLANGTHAEKESA